MKILLISLDEGHHVWETPVRELPIHIGRHPDVGFRLDDDSVSDFHCLLDEINGVLWVRDLGSEEGTFVNGFHVIQSHLLPGDRLTVGMTSFQVCYHLKRATIGERPFNQRIGPTYTVPTTERGVPMMAETCIDDLSADQIGNLLTQDGGQTDKHLAVVVHECVEDMGGPEKAEVAIAVLGELEASV